jgi:hypothetical protein
VVVRRRTRGLCRQRDTSAAPSVCPRLSLNISPL